MKTNLGVEEKMTDSIDLKQIERSAYTSYHQDGLIDIMVGISLLWFIVAMASEMIWLGGIIVPILLPVYIGAKQKLTIPRIGYVKFGTQRKIRLFLVLGILMAFVFLAFLMGLMFLDPVAREAFSLFLGTYYNLIIAGVAGGLTLLIAISTNILRFYVYAILFLSVFLLAQIISLDLLVTSSFIASSFMVLGIYTLIRFLHDNPIQPEGL
jgi:hypothetical protein